MVGKREREAERKEVSRTEGGRGECIQTGNLKCTMLLE